MFVKTDRFGNKFVLVGCKNDKKNPDFNKGFVKIQNKLYKVEVSHANKEGYAFWVKLTALPNRNNNNVIF